ncbi:Stk1 family PASTA domain-containing Ser/Thr kinase [Lachnospira pectinoschiza]|uniref:non-specific serine/threonine protein kinase n=1 Tax=Lachnospira pectinoschiza TaxID=28052 RepID=A0A1G9Z433_9FIRM|nr:Stk1 family PASTA domain-containing Ser/Thr kinase [Lachnospira pectinoschiza]SDN15426.1 serine/threonine protein kinase [Lachnospira pectinoschiza]
MLRKGQFLADRYEILEQIGAGGMADVYKAKCHKLNRFVAIKVMKKEFSDDKTFVTKFRAEAQSAAGLTHSNVVSVYDVGDEDGIYYIVMELVEGITLKKYIEKRGRIPFKEAASIAIQVVNGMEAAHKAGVVHRDIKPQNIIISKDGKVKVTDFGIAKVSSNTTINSSQTMGSVHYISPEQARGGYSDARTDIYSMGITIFEMLTGTVPFDADNSVTVAVKHIQDKIPLASTLAEGIPVSIDKIVAKCTEKKPDRRYQTAEELLADLKKSLVMPDVDFVKMAPIMEDEMSKKEENEELNEDLDVLDDDNEETLEDLDDEDGVLDDEDEDEDDIDDESNEKLDKIMKYIGIGIAAIILIITVFVILKLVGCGSSSTETETETTTVSEDDSSLVSVPDVTGKSKEEAIEALNEVSLGYSIVTQSSSTVEEGYVISQGTTAGSKVSANTRIVLTVSKGTETETVSVTNVKGMTEEKATETLKDLGFEVEVEYAYSTTVEAGNVISYSPTGSAEKGSTITIKVSRGEEEKTVTMIDLTGMSESSAISWLTSNSLTYTIQYQTSSGEYGYVTAQNYKEGASVTTSTSIVVTVSHKEATVDIPDVTEMSSAKAKSTLEAAGFNVSTVTAASDTVAKGNVISYSPTGSAVKGSTITITVSSGPAEIESGTNEAGTN